MRYLIALAALVAALAVPAGAGAGGWATVGFAPLPDDVGPGDTWKPEITILQHGVTPLDGLSPTVTIAGAETSEVFMAVATGEPGKYVANVVFPSAGSYGITIDSTFGDSKLTYGPVDIRAGGAPATTGGGDGDSVVTVLAAIAAIALAAAAAAFALVRQRRLRPAA
jgi:hypothetical protein